MKIKLFDRLTYNLNSKREYTDEGFLKVPGRVARVGIQDYLASELKLPGDPDRIVKVFRPAEEVFKDESLESYNYVDITDNHPDRLVDAKNFKEVTVGLIAGKGVQDGDFVVVDHIFKDAEVIKLIESGKVELSAGYEAEYVKESGKTDDGVEYEFVQRDIRINHVAVVNNARAGSTARIFDNQNRRKLMKVTLDNGRTVEVEDAVAAQVEDCITRLTKDVETEKEKADKAQAKADALHEENEESKKKSSDEAISECVAIVGKTLDAARKLVGKEFICDSVDSIEIKRTALTAHKKDRDFKDETPAYIEAFFDVEMEKKEAEDEEEKEKKKNASDSHKQLSKDMSNANDGKDKPTNKQKFNDSLTNGWQKTVNGGDK